MKKYNCGILSDDEYNELYCKVKKFRFLLNVKKPGNELDYQLHDLMYMIIKVMDRYSYNTFDE